jgi:enterochelin esterase-like enzyme
MGLLHCLTFALLAFAAPCWAGSVLERTVESPALGKLLPYSIYLPDGALGGGQRLPVIYLLHGYGGDRSQWVASGRIEPMLDAAIAAGTLPPVIVVMPSAENSWYVDSGRFGGPGDYETAIVRDLVGEVDRTYPTRRDRRGRAIAGLSMGGFGALRIAFRHPQRFGAVAALSPAIWKPGAHSWTHGPASMERRAAAAKFRRTTGKAGFDAAVMAEQVPFADVPRVAGLEEPPRIMLTVGDDDQMEHYDGTLEMFLDLRAAGLKPELRVRDGGHDWNHWRPLAKEVLAFLGAGWQPGS